MNSGLQRKLERINAKMAEVVELTHKALRGEGRFGVQEVRKIREPLTEMEPILADAVNLRRAQPELGSQLDLYRSYLLNLQKSVEQLRVSLLVQRASLEARRARVEATTQWCAAFHQTR